MAAEQKVGPGDFDEEKCTWKNYKKQVLVWKNLTKLPNDKKGSQLWCVLTGKAKAAIQDMDIAEINHEDGLDMILDILDAVFEIDENQAAYLAYQEFETFLRPAEVSLQDYAVKFESLNSKLKSHGMKLPEGVLAYRFLNSANLSKDEMDLCRATITEFKYTEMKKKVLNLFHDKAQQQMMNSKIKEEPVFYGGHTNNQGQYRYPNGRGSGWRGGRASGRGGRGGFGADRGGYGADRGGYGSERGASASGMGQQRGRGNPYNAPSVQPGRLNPTGRFGTPSTCAHCGSKFHWVRDCPDKNHRTRADHTVNYNETEVHIELLQKSESSMRLFVGETMGCAVIDSGCSKTVAGRQWVDCYREQVNTDGDNNMKIDKSNNVFRFGKGAPVVSQGRIKLPAKIGSQTVTIEADIVDVDIPLLLSKESLKMAGTVLDFNHDSALMFGEQQTLIATKSGHYAIPLTPAVDSMQTDEQITLLNKVCKDENALDTRKAAEKLHRQFGHCSAERLTRLIQTSKLWNAENEKLLSGEVTRVSKECNICKQYKKAPPTPIVSLPLARQFNDVVAMDLIVMKHGVYILHIIDLFTRYSVACVRTSKRPNQIIDAIMKTWVSYFGTPRKFLADNGGEFSNAEYREMCESLNIDMMKTAAESPWSNGVCERHNAVIKESVLKTVEESNCQLATAVAWAVSAKNSLHGHLGYSPNTLVFGKNPNFPSVTTDKLPALQTDQTTSVTVEENLKAMRAARENYVKAESSNRIKRALQHNVRTSCEAIYSNGDNVYFKRDKVRQWHGPARVIGQDGKQVILRYDSQVVRVHVLRITPVSETSSLSTSGNSHDKESSAAKSSDAQSMFSKWPLSVIEEDDTEEEEETAHEEDVHQVENGNVEDNQITTSSTQNDLPDVTPANQDDTTQIPASEEENADNDEETVPQDDMNRVLPNLKSNILYKFNAAEEWRHGFVHSRAGKTKGKNNMCLNIQDDETNEINWYDFGNTDRRIIWEQVPAEIMITNTDQDSINIAKLRELENWKDNNAYEEVERADQKLISTRWVITTKEKDGNMITKPRLCARGYEDQGVDKMNTNSPTCSKETIRIALATLAANGWHCKSIDVKSAFLQGKLIEREIFIKPPKEANTDKVWKCKKAVYGLNEASRHWYDKVKEELSKLGFSCSKFDEAFFYHTVGDSLKGVLSVHVDDFLNGGDVAFERKVSELKDIFQFGTEVDVPMKFLGTNISQDKDGIILLDQDDYTQDIEKMELENKNNKTRVLERDEQYQYRAVVGQLNWLCSQSRPDLAFDVCQLSTKLNDPTVRDASYANRVIRKAKSHKYPLKFNKLKYPLHLLAFCDASYANLSDGSSQGGSIIFLADKEDHVSPISWCSRKLRRVCKSTEAAETMAMLDAIDSCVWIGSLLNEIMPNKIEMSVIKTDNRSLHDAVHSTTAVEEKRLRVEIAAIREAIRRKEVQVDWIPKTVQLADCLTKQGADSKKLMEVLAEGRLQ